MFVADVIAAAAEVGGVSREALTGPRGPSDVCRVRERAMFVATQITPRSATQIGRAFGRRDHCTVILARKRVVPQLTHDQAVASAVAEIQRRAHEIAAKAGRVK